MPMTELSPAFNAQAYLEYDASINERLERLIVHGEEVTKRIVGALQPVPPQEGSYNPNGASTVPAVRSFIDELIIRQRSRVGLANQLEALIATLDSTFSAQSGGAQGKF